MEENIKEIKQKTISGMFWRFSERTLSKLISLVVSIILARILLPEEYGIIAIVTVFIALADVFVTNGLGTALIQKKNSDEIDFSTMFYASICFGIILYMILFLSAPVISNIYQNEILTPILRVMGLRIPIAAINSIQQAYVSKHMIYRKFFYSTLIGTIASAIVGIAMAKLGYGVWALVAQYLTNAVFDTAVLSVTVKWRPKLIFSIKRFKALFSYGWKIMMSNFIGTFFNQLKGLIIGIKYTPTDLAFYNRGEQIPLFISNNINSTVESVLFPAISKVQDNVEMLKKAVRRMMKVSSYIIMPMLLGLAATAETLVTIILTDKWLACVPFLIVICFQECLSILNTANLQAIKATGRSDIFLKLELIKKPIYLVFIIITMFISPLAMAIGNALYGIVALCINAKPNKTLLNYSIREQIKDVMGNFWLAATMFIIVTFIGKLSLNIYVILILQILVGVFYYIGLSKLLKLETYEYIKNTIKEFIKSRKLKKF